jgi:hypothetical protein
MTEMSDPDCLRSGPAACKPLQSLAGFPLARRVHRKASLVAWLNPALLVVLSLVLVGCIIPPSLSSDNQDAGVNSPPSITAVRADNAILFEPGPVSLTRGSGTIQFELLDTDVQDTLVVRIFIDYTVKDPTPARSQCTAPPTGEPKRTVTCSATAICQVADDGQTRNMTIVVFDRMPLEIGKPEFQAMPEGGQSTSRFYFANCSGPAT